MTRAPLPPVAASLLALALLVAACGGSPGPTTTPDAPSTAGPGASATVAPPTSTPAGETPGAQTPAPTTAPSATAPGDTPAPGGTASPVPTPDLTPIPGSADACSGSDQNRAFFADTAGAVAWDVYCGVLPAGWFVETGSYRLANGGKLEITYAGPGGARLSLSQGAFCADGSGCVPAGPEAGDAAFGDRSGTLVAADGGRWAIVVDRGAPISWLLMTTGLDEAQTRAFGEALAIVAG